MKLREILQSLFIICLSFSSSYVKADLPVHCLQHQIVGKWKLMIADPVETHYAPCGHSAPDNEKTSLYAMQSTFTPTQEEEVELRSDNSVKGKSGTGTWSMVYDEGFHIQLGDKKYFAFSEYNEENGKYKSNCGSTLVGWYNDNDNKYKGCYRAEKVNKDGSEVSDNNLERMYYVQPEFAQTKQNDDEEIITTTTNVKRENEQDYIDFQNENFSQHQQVANRLNKLQKSWKAGVNKAFMQMNTKTLNKYAGRRKHSFKKNPSAVASFVEVSDQSFFDTDADSTTNFKNYAVQDVSDLPKEFDWSEYLQAPREQKNCGSCYIFSTMAMLQARLRIKHDEHVQLSVQHSLDCNYYNQGCDGGYPFLVEKFANEFELVREQCHPYTGVNGRCTDGCDISQEEKIYKVHNYKFIGGAYGKSNERDMMIELMNNGPIVASFEPAYDFMYYTSGIYHSVDAADWIIEGEKKPEWEKVDHSVLLVGWGEDDGEKYWLLQNTWGTDWGENGMFRMRRGTDESSIESLGEAADPYVIKQSNNNSYTQLNASEDNANKDNNNDKFLVKNKGQQHSKTYRKIHHSVFHHHNTV